MLRRLIGRLAPKPERDAAHLAYTRAVAQARAVPFYAEHGVPDTFDGRFEMIALHLFLIMYRLRGDEQSRAFRQTLYDLFFADMDRALRELGTGDLSVGKHVKRMASSFAGRLKAYEEGLEGRQDLDAALARNVFGTLRPDETRPGGKNGSEAIEGPAPEQVAALRNYLLRQAAYLREVPAAELSIGEVRFGPLDFTPPPADI